MSQQNVDGNVTATTAVPDSSEESSSKAQQKKPSVPSKSAREKKKEQHKKFLNQKVVQNRLNPKLDAKRHISEDDLAAVLEECRRTVVQQPPRQVSVQIDTDALDATCKNTVQYLYNVGKVQAFAEGGADVDAQNLKKVVMAQAAAKIHIARRHNGKLVNVEDSDYVNRVEKRFTVLPKVLNVYIEQIGHFEVDGQVFIPSKQPPLAFKKLASNQYMTTITRNSPEGEFRAIITIAPENLGDYVNEAGVVSDPLTVFANGHGTITWVPTTSLGDFRDLCTWYEGFISRCSRKAGNILENVVYGKGEGTPALLVGSRYDARISQLEIWCAKKIDHNSLQIGGLFGYGYESTDAFHNEAIACITDRIDTEGMYQRIQRCQKL